MGNDKFIPRGIGEGKQARGFTLLEVLVVVGVFSVLTVVCFTAISRYLDVSESLETRNQKIQRLDRMFLLLDRDLRYALTREVRNDLTETEPSYISFNTDGLPGEVIRVTTSFPGLNESGLESFYRVAWQFDTDRLYRNVWKTLDNRRTVEPAVQLLLEGVSDFLVEEFYWSDDYGLQASTTLQGQHPSGVRVTLLLEDGREYERIIDLVNGS